MYLQFDREEYEDRIARACLHLREENFDALIIFGPESHYYLTGFDTTGFVFFQCGILVAETQRLVLLTRPPDKLQAKKTSIYEEIRLWRDGEGNEPAQKLKEILAELELRGVNVGLEMDTVGLKASNYEMICRHLASWCTLTNASHIVQRLRMVKSTTELRYVREAAKHTDDALIAMIEASKPGRFEGDIAAAGADVLFKAGCDPAPSGPVLGSGDRALLVRATTNYRNLLPVDQLTMEFAASYRHYCCCIMRTIAIGRESGKQRKMFDVACDALEAMTDVARANNEIGQIDAQHRSILDRNGFKQYRMAACGYSLGARFRPSWMDTPPMIYKENNLILSPGMVLFLHVIIADWKNNLAMSLGHTIIVTESQAERLSKIPLEYAVRE